MSDNIFISIHLGLSTHLEELLSHLGIKYEFTPINLDHRVRYKISQDDFNLLKISTDSVFIPANLVNNYGNDEYIAAALDLSNVPLSLIKTIRT